MGKILAKCCKVLEEPEDPATSKEMKTPRPQKQKDRDMVVENLDRSEVSMLTNAIPEIRAEKPLRDPQSKETAELLPKNEKGKEKEKEKEKEENIPTESKENTFQEKSNNFQEIFKSPGKSRGNSENLIQELREIQKSQLALIKSKQHPLPNQIDENVENFDKNKKVTDIFNGGSARKEKEEPERPPKIEEKDEEEETSKE